MLGVLAVWFSLDRLIGRRAPAVPVKRIWLPVALYGMVCLWAWIQSLSLTPEWLHHPLWKLTSEAMGVKLYGVISVNPYETRTTLMRLLTYGAVFWLAVQLGRDMAKADVILKAVMFAIGTYALYGLVLWSIGSETILWYEKKDWSINDRGGITSTFINRNNFATFVGLGCVTFLALFIRSMRRSTSVHEDEPVKYFIDRMANKFAGMSSIYLLGLLMTMGALFLSNSRAGFAFTLTACAVYLGVQLFRGRASVAKAGAVVTLAICVFIVLFNVSGNTLTARFAQGDIIDSRRVAVYKRMVQAIADSPVLGTGYGTFPDVFPMYRDNTVSSWGRWDKGHNTYLEVMMELGLPAASALFLAVALCVYMCFRGALERRRSSHIPMAAFAGSILVALHSTVDFSLQIPAVTITYATLLGLGCAQSWSSQTH